MRQLFSRIARWIGGREPVVLVSSLIVVLGVWGFIEIADEVVEQETRAFDEWVVQSLRRPDNLRQPIGPEWMAEAVRDITALGSAAVLVLVTLAVAGYLWLAGKWHAALFLLAAAVGGFLVSDLLKELFARDRPDVVPHLAQVYNESFPSGHAMMAAVVYLTLGTLLTTLVARRRLKTYFLVLALLLAVLIGLSRIYLGVHYPTDVLAGWSLGLAWAVLCWMLARWFQRRGTVESEPADGRNEKVES